MDPIEILVNEHSLIYHFLNNLSTASEKLETDELPPREFFEKALQFASSFTDRFHHFKEEYVMFVQLAQKTGGVLDGQIDSLRHQHERGRNLLIEISNSLDGYARGDEIHMTILIENLAAYISLLRHHLHKEDHSFYQMIKKELSESDLQGLVELFNAEDQKAGGKIFESSEKLVQEMSSMLGT